MNSVMNFSYEQFITKKIHHIHWFVIFGDESGVYQFQK